MPGPPPSAAGGGGPASLAVDGSDAFVVGWLLLLLLAAADRLARRVRMRGASGSSPLDSRISAVALGCAIAEEC